MTRPIPGPEQSRNHADGAGYDTTDPTNPKERDSMASFKWFLDSFASDAKKVFEWLGSVKDRPPLQALKPLA